MNTTQKAIKSIRNYLENDLGLEISEALYTIHELKNQYWGIMEQEINSSVDEEETDPIGSEEETDEEEEFPQETKGTTKDLKKALESDGKETPEGPEDFLEDKDDKEDGDLLDDDDWDDDEDEEEKPKKKKK